MPKPGKPPHAANSYAPISYLPMASKLFGKLFIKGFSEIVIEKNLIPEYQFSFRSQHSITDQIYRHFNIIQNTIEENIV